MKITPEMFKTICTFDRITPRFLSIVFGLGRKTASVDEHYMTCHHHLSISTETKDNEVNCKDEYEGQENSRQNQYESYGLSISFAHKSALQISSSIHLAVPFQTTWTVCTMPEKAAELLQKTRHMLQYPPF